MHFSRNRDGTHRGAGLLVAEIQQTSDITYLYDFDRVDAQGNTRELHVDLALEAINYKGGYRIDLKEEKSNTIVNCPYFTTNFIPLIDSATISKTGDSFTVYMCIDGALSTIRIYISIKGDTVLIPAAMDYYVINGKASILEIYIS
jgi:mannose-6-phosphate isomerase